MTKVIQFPAPVPEKFGHQRVSKVKTKGSSKSAQLDLFQSAGRVVRLRNLSPFEDALLHDDSQHLAEAKSLYHKAIDEKDSVADAYCNLGILESLEGNTATAIDCFSKSLREDPRHFEAHYNLANLYADVGDYALAILHYRVAIEVEPEFPNSYFNLGLTHAMVKEYEEAVKVLKQYHSMVAADEQKLADDLIGTIHRTQG